MPAGGKTYQVTFDTGTSEVRIEVAEDLGIGQQAAGADAEIQPAIEQMIEHRDLDRDGRGMAVRQVDRAGAEPHGLDAAGQAGEEHGAGGDVLRQVGDVLADIALAKAERVGEQERLLVLAQRFPPVAANRMDRHREDTELHGAPPFLNVTAA